MTWRLSAELLCVWSNNPILHFNQSDPGPWWQWYNDQDNLGCALLCTHSHTSQNYLIENYKNYLLNGSKARSTCFMIVIVLTVSRDKYSLYEKCSTAEWLVVAAGYCRTNAAEMCKSGWTQSCYWEPLQFGKKIFDILQALSSVSSVCGLIWDTIRAELEKL